jgi:hypothetical protein
MSEIEEDLYKDDFEENNSGVKKSSNKKDKSPDTKKKVGDT